MTDPSAAANFGLNAPQDTAVAAVVNDPAALITLYGPDNRQIAVHPGDVDFWLNNGFRQNKLDIRATASELAATMRATADLIGPWVEGVAGDGYIDTSDESNEAAMFVAMGKVSALYNQLASDIHAVYKTRGNLSNKERAALGLPSVKAEVDADNARRAALGEPINTEPQPDFPAA